MTIKPYPQNAKKHPDKQLKQIAASIERFGFRQPIVIDKDGTIIVGHGRYEAATKILEWTELRGAPEAKKGEKIIPYIIADDLTEDEIKAYRLADNKLNESGWDMGIVDLELKGLDDELIKLTGFELDNLEAHEDDFDVESVSKNVHGVELGDIYELGEHRLMCGDSTKVGDVEKLMNGQVAEMVFTDPPYGIDLKYGKGDGNGLSSKINYDQIVGDKDTDTAKAVFSYVLMLDADIVYWGANYFTDFLPPSRCWISWYKKDGLPSDDFCDTELAYTNADKHSKTFSVKWKGMIKEGEMGQKRIHPNQKPIKLIVEIFEYLDTKRCILDLFGGSGSTLIACEQTNRKCYMMELDPHYCSVIIERWQQFTNKKAAKL